MSTNRKTEPYSETIGFRVTRSMMDTLEAMANEQMITVSSVVRQMVARELGLIPRSPNLLVDSPVEYSTEDA